MVEPYHWAATGESQHAQVVTVGGVDAPFTVGGQEVKDQAGFTFGLVKYGRVEFCLEGGQPLMELAVIGMIQIQGLTASKGAPGYAMLHIQGVGGEGGFR